MLLKRVEGKSAIWSFVTSEPSESFCCRFGRSKIRNRRPRLGRSHRKTAPIIRKPKTKAQSQRGPRLLFFFPLCVRLCQWRVKNESLIGERDKRIPKAATRGGRGVDDADDAPLDFFWGGMKRPTTLPDLIVSIWKLHFFFRSIRDASKTGWRSSNNIGSISVHRNVVKPKSVGEGGMRLSWPTSTTPIGLFWGGNESTYGGSVSDYRRRDAQPSLDHSLIKHHTICGRWLEATRCRPRR